MFVVRQGETAEAAMVRREIEAEAAQRKIAEIDGDVISEANDIALTQMNNLDRNIPLDYAAILRGRAARPELFTFLPNDDECRKALGQRKRGG